MAREDKEKRNLDAYTQAAESTGTGSGDPTADDSTDMDITAPGRGGHAGENSLDWEEAGVDTGGGMDPDGVTATGGSWGDDPALDDNAAGPGAGDWVSERATRLDKEINNVEES